MFFFVPMFLKCLEIFWYFPLFLKVISFLVLEEVTFLPLALTSLKCRSSVKCLHAQTTVYKTICMDEI